MSDPRPEEYQIGWICALATELTASRLFFDRVYTGDFDLAPNDGNTYQRGRMGRHNVVMAVLPDETGIANAAIVTRDMVRSYPNLKVVLMVGIGGGAPSARNDIRLGDVVVSSKTGRHGAVIQYDFGKEHQGREFENTSHLGLPPTSVRTAINVLKSNHEMEGTESMASKIEESLKSRIKTLRKKYSRPDESTDQLFHSDYVHVGNDTCEVCDRANLLREGGREDDDDAPHVHYGLIASGNRVMRDAKTRDTLAKEYGVLCFEMEAAGMMNHCPSLVIRGICDYSDSHKNKHWQGYAAMTAAAYAKELLEQLQPHTVQGDEKLAQALKDDVSETKKTVKRIAELEHKKAFHEWLSKFSAPGRENNQSQTVKWFLDSPKFQRWKQTPNTVLYCSGIPGAGKTTMASIAADHLQEVSHDGKVNASVASIYYSSDDQQGQKQRHVLCSLLDQLIRTDGLPESVDKKLRHRQSRNEPPPVEDVLACVRIVLQSSPSRVYIVIDALDESSSSAGYDLHTLKLILGLRSHATFNILATSTPNENIHHIFGTLIDQDNLLHLRVSPTEDDLRPYVEQNLNLEEGPVEDENLKQAYMGKVAKVSSGMFLLASLLCDSYRDLQTPEQVRTEINKMTTNPMNLTARYEKSLSRIKGQGFRTSNLALRVLRWVAYAGRRMSTLELRHAVTVTSDTPAVKEESLPALKALLSVCAGLVRESPNQADRVEMVHSTARDFVKAHDDFKSPLGMAEVPMTCINYLSSTTFRNGPSGSTAEFAKRRQLYPLFVYASSYWGHHAAAWAKAYQATLDNNQSVDPSGQAITQKITDFLRLQNNLLASFEGYHLRFPGDKYPRSFSSTGPLHLAAKYGLSTVLGALLEDRLNVNEIDGYGDTPLINAARHNHSEVAKLLLNRAELHPNIRDKRHQRTALSFASSQKDGITLVEELLRSPSVQVDLPDHNGRTPLSYAADSGHEDIVRFLIETTPARLDKRERHNLAPFTRAAMSGHVEIVKYFLTIRERQMTTASSKLDWRGLLNSAFTKTAEVGNVEILRLLHHVAKDDIDVDHRNHYGQTPLWLAIKNGHFDTAKLLVQDYGADPTIPVKNGASLILLSFLEKQGRMIDAFLGLVKDEDKFPVPHQQLWSSLSQIADRPQFETKLGEGFAALGLDACSKDMNGRTPLHWAASRGFSVLVGQFLRQADVDPDVCCNDGRTALWFAVQEQHEAVVRLLLATKRVDVNMSFPATNSTGMRNHMYQSHLHLTIHLGNTNIFDLLLCTGKLNLSQRDWKLRTPIIVAAGKGLVYMVRRLLVELQKAEIDLQDHLGQTALMAAVDRGHPETVQLLLEGGTDVNIRDKRRRTALSIAVLRGNTKILSLFTNTLLKPSRSENKGSLRVIMNMADHKYRTPLIAAVHKGNIGIVRTLAECPRVIASAQDRNGRTALHISINAGRCDLVSVLAPISKTAMGKRDCNGRTPLFLVVKKGNLAIDILKELVKLPPDWVNINQTNTDGLSVLCYAVRTNSWAAVEVIAGVPGVDLGSKSRKGMTALSDAVRLGVGLQFLQAIQRGLDLQSVHAVLNSPKLQTCVASRDDQGKTVLIHALEKGNTELTKMILESTHISINMTNDKGQTPLMAAASLARGNAIMLQLLLAMRKQEVDVNAQCKYGRTALSYAAERGHLEATQQLLAHPGVDPNLADGSKRTPLSYACAVGHGSVVKLLLGVKGINIRFRDHNEMTPFSHAVRKGREGVVELLLARSDLNPDAQGQYRQTPLMDAVRSGHRRIAEMLLETGRVKINALDKNKKTPLWHALECNQTDLARFLVERGGINPNPGARRARRRID